MQKRFLLLYLFIATFSSFPALAQIEAEGLTIIRREEWKAEKAGEGLRRHIPSKITIHHTGTGQDSRRSLSEKLLALQKFSLSEGFLADGTPKKSRPDVPYHFYIALNGSVAEGRELQYEGDSNTDYDLNGHALIVVEGNFDRERINFLQQSTLRELVKALAKRYKIPASAISGHKDQAQTSCPGQDLYQLLPRLREEIAALDPSRVIIGAEQLLTPKYEALVRDKRVGLITNHTGVLPNGKHLIDMLHEDPRVHLVKLFGPEHGLRGEEDNPVADGRDPGTGLPIFSLYGAQRKPGPEMLRGVDVLVFDIQDIGARYYTYIKTMLLAQEAAAEHKIPFIVLDRPNPVTGTYIDGPVGKPLEPSKEVGVIPVTHGMTVGELALMFNGEREAKGLPPAQLTVIPLLQYKREQWYDETGLPWIKPSPNMLYLQTAVVYPATCLLEGTNYSEARGTLFPFERFGAPWVNGEELAGQLNSYGLEGVKFRSTSFVPEKVVDGIEIYPPKFLNETVHGVEMLITDRDRFKSAETGIYILHALKLLYPSNFEWREARIDGLLGTDRVRRQLDNGASPPEIIAAWKEDLLDFGKKRIKYLLY